MDPRNRRQYIYIFGCRLVGRKSIVSETDMDDSHSSNVELSKSLSWILRHGVKKVGLQMQPDGYVNVDAILNLRNFQRNKWTAEEIIKVVECDEKQRFSLKTCNDGNTLAIRANQGHTIEDVDDELLLEKVKRIEDLPPLLAHGTFLKKWPLIKVNGLNRMTRRHIHFAPGLPGDSSVISGMRANTEVYIIIDGKQAMNDGYTFYRSQNNVWLCPGNKDGYIPAKYNKEVWTMQPYRRIA
ncbi:TRPT1 (predicted) [Pycnogonum litorale]